MDFATQIFSAVSALLVYSCLRIISCYAHRLNFIDMFLDYKSHRQCVLYNAVSLTLYM